MKKLILVTSFILSTTILIAQLEESCLPEGITFSMQVEIDSFQTNYPDCTEIEGDVTINGEDITNLNGLSVLTAIGGTLVINNTSLSNMNGLNNLLTVAGDMLIGAHFPGNPFLVDLNGLEALTSIGGALFITGNNSLNSLNGLEGLTSIGGELSVGSGGNYPGNNSLISLTGLQGLTSIGGTLSIYGNDALTSLSGLDGVTSIMGNLYIRYNAALTNLSGLEGITSIMGNLNISYNAALTNLSGLEGITSIMVGIHITNNLALTSLTGLDNLVSIEGNLNIVHNDSLSVCDVSFICDYLSDPPGTIEIHNNAPGCSGQLELAYNCGITYECLTNGTYHFYCQGDIDYFTLVYPGCTNLTADMNISGNDITNLDSLNVITSIGGALFITGNNSLNSLNGLEGLTSIDGNLGITSNSSLTNFAGLDELDSIGGYLFITSNHALINLTGLEGLVSIGESFMIGNAIYGGYGNSALKNLNALESLDTIGGDLIIYYNDSLSVCDAPFLCDYLSDPSGNIEIHNNAPGCNSHLQLAYDCGITYSCLTNGTYHLYSQGDIDYFPLVYTSCTNLTADVTITGSDIMNLDSLSIITSIEGNLSVYQTNIPNFSGLENLTFISGDFSTSYFDEGCIGNDALVNFTGMEGLDSIGGSLSVFCNGALSNLSGMEGLSSVKGNVQIGGNDLLANLIGLEGLVSIGGNLQIGGFNYYQGNFGNSTLSSLNGLGNLNTVVGDLGIGDNPSLTNLTGLESLDTINGSFSISDNDVLTNLSNLEGLTYIGSNLSIDYNDGLISLTGLEELDYLGGDLRINNNDSLCNCDTEGICNYLSNPTGSVNIYNNAPGCNNPSQIADSCGYTIPCLPFGNYYFTCQEDIDYFQDDYPDCTELNGYVNISGVDINNLSGLNEVTLIGGTLRINHNDSLTDLTGLEDLTSIGGSLTIWANDTLTSISSLEGLTSIGDELRISSNNILTSLSGLDNIDAESIDGLYIKGNITLSECSVQSICDYLATPNADVTITDNADGCNNLQEVEQACTTINIDKETVQMEQLVFYPNPVNSTGHLKGIISEENSIFIYIYNTTGSCLKSWQFANQSNTQQEFTINLNDLPQGIYFIQVLVGIEMLTKKVVKW